MVKCVCVCVCVSCLHIYCVCVCMYACMCMHVCMYMCVCVCVCECMHVCAYMHAYMNAWVCICVCVCVFVCVWLCSVQPNCGGVSLLTFQFTSVVVTSQPRHTHTEQLQPYFRSLPPLICKWRQLRKPFVFTDILQVLSH